MNAQGYKTEPLSAELELRIENRITWLKLYLTAHRTYLASQNGEHCTALTVAHTQGNITALEWVLREAEQIKQE